MNPPICWTRKGLEKSPNLLVPAYLTASYLYYLHPEEEPIMSDTDYDWVCIQLLKHWDDITHPHKANIEIDDVKAGTGMSLREHDYPGMAKSCAIAMSRGTLHPKPLV